MLAAALSSRQLTPGRVDEGKDSDKFDDDQER